ncbi:MAG: TIGR02678 family protein, partial [Myxococcales bacterium]|nr:TIGR02678 family protein [Myxococcales bacterium]
MNAAEADLRASVRTLLASPLLRRAAAPDAYERVRRNLAPVEAWFAQTTGWSVVHDRPSGLIRVLKITDRSDATRSPVPEFTRRHYAIACLLLAELDRAGRQTTLRWLAEQLAEATRAEPTIEDYDATQIGERRAFVHVVRWLVDGVGVLRGRDPAGAGETRYLQTERGSDALYDVDDRVLALLLAAPRSPSALASPAELAEGEAIETDDMQRLARGRRVYRRLLDEPVVYFDTLAQDEHDWLLRSLRRVTEQLARIGLVIERRLEGIAVIDPEG